MRLSAVILCISFFAIGKFGGAAWADDSGYVRIDLRRGGLNHLLVWAKRRTPH